MEAAIAVTSSRDSLLDWWYGQKRHQWVVQQSGAIVEVYFYLGPLGITVGISGGCPMGILLHHDNCFDGT